MKEHVLALLILLGLPVLIYSQSTTVERLREEIAFNADIMVNAEKDVHRLRAHSQMELALDSFLLMENSYSNTLDSIPWLSVLHADDFRLVTWQLKISDEEYKYGGFLQWDDKVVRLKDSRPFINGAAYTSFTPAGWYGCLYYKIIPFRNEGEDSYLLFGFNAENSQLNTKIADVLDLSGQDPRFGVPIFKGNGEPRSRLLLTYADVSNAHLAYDDQLGGIVHDHLETLPGVGAEGEALPVSDGSLEAWILKNGKWVYEEEVYDVQQKEPPMSDERKDRKEDKDILGRPKNP